MDNLEYPLIRKEIKAKKDNICTPHGFIEDTKEALDEYKKKYKEGWNLEFDKYWDKVTKD